MMTPQQITITLADELALVREGIGRLCETSGRFSAVWHCGDGISAYQQILEKQPDIALVDFQIPHMFSLELVRRVRMELHDAATPIVLVSTLGSEADVRHGLSVGATAYVIKPLSPHHIKAALRKILDTQLRRA